MTLFVFIISFFMILSGCSGASGDSPQTGELYIVSDPAMDAAIEIDGKKTGKTTDTGIKNVKPGRHIIRVRKDNPDRPDLPFIGEATVNVEAGKKHQVIIRLNVMTVQPKKRQSNTIIAETEGQKTVIDFCKAINNKDYATAYALLSGKLKKTYRTSKNFTKYWQNINAITLNRISPAKLPDQNAATETDILELTVSYNPPNPKALPVPPEAAVTDPNQPINQHWSVVTEGDPKDPSEIWRINEINKLP